MKRKRRKERGTREWEGSRAVALLNPTSKYRHAHTHTHTHTHTEENHPQREAAITVAASASLWADDEHRPTSMTHSLNPLKRFGSIKASPNLRLNKHAMWPGLSSVCNKPRALVLIFWVCQVGGGGGGVKFDDEVLWTMTRGMTQRWDERGPRDACFIWRPTNSGNSRIYSCLWSVNASAVLSHANTKSRTVNIIIHNWCLIYWAGHMAFIVLPYKLVASQIYL